MESDYNTFLAMLESADVEYETEFCYNSHTDHFYREVVVSRSKFMFEREGKFIDAVVV